MRVPDPLVSSLAGDPEMAELVQLFVSELPERMAALRSALDSRDFRVAARLTHQLRGSAAGYGFAPIGLAAGAVEDLLRAGSGAEQVMAERLVDTVNELRALCDRAAAARSA